MVPPVVRWEAGASIRHTQNQPGRLESHAEQNKLVVPLSPWPVMLVRNGVPWIVRNPLSRKVASL